MLKTTVNTLPHMKDRLGSWPISILSVFVSVDNDRTCLVELLRRVSEANGNEIQYIYNLWCSVSEQVPVPNFSH